MQVSKCLQITVISFFLPYFALNQPLYFSFSHPSALGNPAIMLTELRDVFQEWDKLNSEINNSAALISIKDAALALSPIDKSIPLKSDSRVQELRQWEPFRLLAQHRALEKQIKKHSIFKKWFGSGRKDRQELAHLEELYLKSDLSELHPPMVILNDDITDLKKLKSNEEIQGVRNLTSLLKTSSQDETTCKPKNGFFGWIKKLLRRREMPLRDADFQMRSLLAAVVIRDSKDLDTLDTLYHRKVDRKHPLKEDGRSVIVGYNRGVNELGMAMHALNPVMTRWFLENITFEKEGVAGWESVHDLSVQDLYLNLSQKVDEGLYLRRGKLGSQKPADDLKAIYDILLEKKFIDPERIEMAEATRRNIVSHRHQMLLTVVEDAAKYNRPVADDYLKGYPLFLKNRAESAEYVSPLGLAGAKNFTLFKVLVKHLNEGIRQDALTHTLRYLESVKPKTHQTEESIKFIIHSGITVESR